MEDKQYIFQLDRTFGKGMSVEEADETQIHYRKSSPEERLRISLYLTSIAYNFSLNDLPKMDKTIYEGRKHEL